MRLLTGSLKPADKAQVSGRNSGTATAQLVVGTQAVIQEAVSFKNLGLAVIDEQHKFGVMQRAQFETGGLVPSCIGDDGNADSPKLMSDSVRAISISL